MRRRNGISKYAAVAVALVVFLPALGALPVFAKGPRKFAGFYRVIQATDQGDKVELRLSLQVFNYSDADVKDATISLKSSLPHPAGAAESWEKEQPSFAGVVLRVNEHTIVPPLEGTFTVPAREYGGWLKGARPGFVIDFRDASGKPQHRAIELARLP